MNLLWLAAGAFEANAQSTWDFAVEVSAVVQADPAKITLVWPQDSSAEPEAYMVYRRGPAGAGWQNDSVVKASRKHHSPNRRQTSGPSWRPILEDWGKGIVLPGSATSFVDADVEPGAAYEYQVVKNTPQYNGYGYIYAGLKVPLIENRGRLLLVVDKTFATELAEELGQLEQDIVGDGWTVKRLEVGRTDAVTSVKALIRAEYEADPATTKAVFLFGHVPVPYSGDIVPDGHAPDHEGAWPCDGYYGDMDGV